MNVVRPAILLLIVAALSLTSTPAAAKGMTGYELLAKRERLTAKCNACFDRAIARAVQGKSVTCSTSLTPSIVGTLRRGANQCARQRACKWARRGTVSKGRVAAWIGRELGCERAQTASLGGLIGEAPAVGGSATFADVADYCATLDPDDKGDIDTSGPGRPPLMALPETTTTPTWCDEAAAYTSVVGACGTPAVVVVSHGGGNGIPDGSPAKPFTSIGDAIAACAGSCHVLVAAGNYTENLDVPACTIIEGGIDVVDDAIVVGADRPRLTGAIRTSGDSVVLARLDVRGDDEALDVNGDALVSDSVLRAGYEVGGASRSVVGPRVCGSVLAANYGGLDLSWTSAQLRVHGSAISACYVGVGASWGSSDVEVSESTIYGHAHAIASFASSDVTIRDNYLGGRYAAVDVHVLGELERAALRDEADPYPTTADAVIEDNVFATAGCGVSAGSVGSKACLTASDPVRAIFLDGNVFE